MLKDEIWSSNRKNNILEDSMETQKSMPMPEPVQPVLKKSPFADSVEHLYRNNLRVADVCYQMRIARVN